MLADKLVVVQGVGGARRVVVVVVFFFHHSLSRHIEFLTLQKQITRNTLLLNISTKSHHKYYCFPLNHILEIIFSFMPFAIKKKKKTETTIR